MTEYQVEKHTMAEWMVVGTSGAVRTPLVRCNTEGTAQMILKWCQRAETNSYEKLETQLAQANAKIDRLQRLNAALIQHLKIIACAEGVYSRDRLTHAENTIVAMKDRAEAALAEAEKHG